MDASRAEPSLASNGQTSAEPAAAEVRDAVFCDDWGLWIHDPLGNCRPFDFHDYESLALERAVLLAAAKAAKAHLIAEYEEPGRTVFWQLVDAIKKATGGAS